VAAAEIDQQLKQIYLQGKQNASYWLGLIAYEQRNYRSAIDYLANRTLESSEHGPWTRGAHYNLGRVYEADRQYDKALAEYRTKTPSPDHHGNLLRARWLESQVGPRQAEAPADSPGP
jgi:tetratricopeptide (TPR) repeat protein